MQRASEIKVGLITLVAIALIVYFLYAIIGVTTGGTYLVYVDFPNALGLQEGNAVQMLGVRIGEVKGVDIFERSAARATLAISRKYRIYSNYRIQVAASGLLQETYVDIIPAASVERAEVVKPGQVVSGQTGTDLTALMNTGEQLLQDLNSTTRTLNQALTQGQLVARLQTIMTNLQEASTAALQLTTASASVARTSAPEVQNALRNINQASVDLEAMTRDVRGRLTKGPTLANVETVSTQLAETTEHINALTHDLESFTGDPQVQSALRDIVANTKVTAEQIRISAENLRVITGETAKAAPEIPSAITSISKIAGTAAQIQERLKPPEIKPSFDILAGPQAHRFISSGRLDIGTSEGHFLRLGIDDIGGTDSAINVQIGEHHGRRGLRYGLVRSKLGVGVDLPLPRRGVLSVDMFDPNDPRADVIGAIPIVSGRTNIDLLIGVRDIRQDAFLVGGARFSR